MEEEREMEGRRVEGGAGSRKGGGRECKRKRGFMMWRFAGMERWEVERREVERRREGNM